MKNYEVKKTCSFFIIFLRNSNEYTETKVINDIYLEGDFYMTQIETTKFPGSWMMIPKSYKLLFNEIRKYSIPKPFILFF